MKFSINNCYTYVKEATPVELEIITDYCSHEVKKFLSLYRDANNKVLPAYRYKQLSPHEKQRWHLKTEFDIQVISYYNDKFNSFPTGWLPAICRTLKEEQIPYQLFDNRNKYNPRVLASNLPTLRYYQDEAVNIAYSIGRGIIEHPTGSGKTVTSCKLIATLGQPTLLIVPNLILLHQTYDYFKEHLQSDLVGMIGDNVWNPGLITISTAQTLWSRITEQTTIDFLQSIIVLIGDECHKINENEEHLPNTWYRVAMKCSNAYYRFGMSATPGKVGSLQRKLLEGVTGRVIYSVPLQELIAKGYLTDAKIIIKKLKMDKISGNWRKSYETNILNNEQRNHAIAMFAESFAKDDKSVLIIVDEVEEHAIKLGGIVKGAVVLTGEANAAERETVISRFRNRQQKILISTLLNEGFDFRGLDCVILASGKKSNKLVAQRVGRALRTDTGKIEAIIVDFWDDDSGYLLKHSKQRLEVYEELGFKIERI